MLAQRVENESQELSKSPETDHVSGGHVSQQRIRHCEPEISLVGIALEVSGDKIQQSRPLPHSVLKFGRNSIVVTNRAQSYTGCLRNVVLPQLKEVHNLLVIWIFRAFSEERE